MRRLASVCWVFLVACGADGDADVGVDAAIGSSSAAVTTTPIPCTGAEVGSTIQGELSLGNSIVFTRGICQVTGPLYVRNDNITIEGAGPSSTQIKFIPTADNQALFTFEDNTATPDSKVLENVTLKNVGLQSGMSAALDRPKTAVYIHDAQNFLLENVAIGPWDAATASKRTTGVQVRGREAIAFRKLHVRADVPLNIGANVDELISGQFRDQQKDLQQAHFQDLFLQSNVSPDPVVVIDPGAVLRNVSFGGYQSWVGGGLLWVDGTSVVRQPSTHVQLANLQVAGICTGQCSDQWAIRIEKNAMKPLAELLLEFSITATRGMGTPVGPGWRGIKASGVTRTVLRQVVYEGQTQPANDITPSPIQDP